MNLKKAKRLRYAVRLVGQDPSKVTLKPLVAWHSLTPGNFSGQRTLAACGRKTYLDLKKAHS